MLNGNELMLGDYVNIADYNYPEVVGKIKAIYTGGEEVLVNILEDSVLFDTKDISEISFVLPSNEVAIFLIVIVFELLIIITFYNELAIFHV